MKYSGEMKVTNDLRLPAVSFSPTERLSPTAPPSSPVNRVPRRASPEPIIPCIPGSLSSFTSPATLLTIPGITSIQDKEQKVATQAPPRRTKAGILSDRDILSEKYAQNLVIEPFNSLSLQSNSYDVTLGENFYRQSLTDKTKVTNPWNKSHVIDYWGSPCLARTATTAEVKAYGLKITDRYIILAPGETILGHTNEFIGGKKDITTSMHARSSLGRMNVCVCRDAGLGDVGFINRYTAEIQNVGLSPILLIVGMRFAQISFHYVSSPLTMYHEKGHYQQTDNLGELMKNWTPESMLPKLYLNTN